jgi:hypothetical protein
VKGAEAIKGVARGYLSDLIRTAVRHEVPQLRVITRENMNVLLSNEKSLDDCEGECEVETGRRIGADLVITADASQVDGAPRLMLKLFDTRTGEDIANVPVKATSALEIESAIPGGVAQLLARFSLGAGANRDFRAGDISIAEAPLPHGTATKLVQFGSDPVGAVVFVDGDMTCSATPCSRELTVGSTRY